MSKQYTLSIWWIKSDMRLLDNLCLKKALSDSDTVIPVFIWEENIYSHEQYSRFHFEAMDMALKDLKANLNSLGSDILIMKGNTFKIFQELKQIYNFEAIYSHQEIGSDITYQRDLNLQKWCIQNKIIYKEFHQLSVIRGLKDRDRLDKSWNKRILNSKIIPSPQRVPLPKSFQTVFDNSFKYTKQTIAPAKDTVIQTTSESSGHNILDSFLKERSQKYRGSISSPNTAFKYGSRLSVHLAYGTLSMKYIYQKTEQTLSSSQNQWQKEGLHAFQSRLQWHDHFIQRLEMEPQMEFYALNPLFENLPYTNEESKLQSWLQGETGVPMIDASMRCLRHTGFINFRMRSMVTSYACHALHLDWRYIMYPLAQLFTDYEPGIHISQLQMQAGVVGINTIRVYNPFKQAIDQDPRCLFIKKWIPELQHLSPPEILSIDTIPLLNSKYPNQIVDFKKETKVMKDALYIRKKSLQNQIEKLSVLHKHGSRKFKKR